MSKHRGRRRPSILLRPSPRDAPTLLAVAMSALAVGSQALVGQIRSITTDPMPASAAHSYDVVVNLYDTGALMENSTLTVRSDCTEGRTVRFDRNLFRNGRYRMRLSPSGLFNEPGSHTCTFELSGNRYGRTEPLDSESFSWTVSGPRRLPDLRIARIELEPSRPRHLRPYYFDVIVANDGPGTIWSEDREPIIVDSPDCFLPPTPMRLDRSSTWSVAPTPGGNNFEPGLLARVRVNATPPLMTAGTRECTFRVTSSLGDDDRGNDTTRFRWTVNPAETPGR